MSDIQDNRPIGSDSGQLPDVDSHLSPKEIKAKAKNPEPGAPVGFQAAVNRFIWLMENGSLFATALTGPHRLDVSAFDLKQDRKMTAARVAVLSVLLCAPSALYSVSLNEAKSAASNITVGLVGVVILVWAVGRIVTWLANRKDLPIQEKIAVTAATLVVTPWLPVFLLCKRYIETPAYQLPICTFTILGSLWLSRNMLTALWHATSCPPDLRRVYLPIALLPLMPIVSFSAIALRFGEDSQTKIIQPQRDPIQVAALESADGVEAYLKSEVVNQGEAPGAATERIADVKLAAQSVPGEKDQLTIIYHVDSAPSLPPIKLTVLCFDPIDPDATPPRSFNAHVGPSSVTLHVDADSKYPVQAEVKWTSEKTIVPWSVHVDQIAWTRKSGSTSLKQ